MSKKLSSLIKDIRKCQLCAQHLAHDPRPIVQLGSRAPILIAGQAPGRRVQESGIPFDDPSGDRLRSWMGVSRDTFYNPDKVSILPMGFCYPGHGKSGDLPPRPECAPAWRQAVLEAMPKVQLTLVIGSYAIEWHIGEARKRTLTETVKAWESYGPAMIPLPHPSPRNNRWLKKNPWFEKEVLPVLLARISNLLA